MKKILLVIVTLMLLCPVFAGAEETKENKSYIEANDFGFSFFTGMMYKEPMDYNLTQNYGASFIYHLGESFAVEPTLFFSRDEDEDANHTSMYIETKKTMSIGGFLGLFYYKSINRSLYFYIGPRLGILSYTSEKSNDTDSSRSKSVKLYYGGFLTIGLKYMFNNHIGLYGDFGFGYLRSKNDTKYWNSSGTLTSDKSSTNNYYSISKSVVGVSLYF
ncbi:MAG: porin family protein [bacterium]|nr:porin family protein [bacterium]